MGESGARIGLGLGSGVARGWAHIGVLRALERCGIKPDIVCGTSIGALMGGVYLGGRLDALEAWARQLTKLRLSRLFDFQLGYGGVFSRRPVLAGFLPPPPRRPMQTLSAPPSRVRPAEGARRRGWWYTVTSAAG